MRNINFINQNLNKQIDNLDIVNTKLKSPKLLNLTILANIFLISLLICFIFYFSSDLSFKHQPILYKITILKYDEAQTAGAIGLYSLIWYVAINIIFFYNINKDFKVSKKAFWNLAFGSFLFNPYAYLVLIKLIQSFSFYIRRTFYFMLNENDQILFDIKNPRAIMGLIVVLVQIPFLVLSSTDYEKQLFYAQEIWLRNLHFFTTQGNWICLITAFIYFINPHSRFARSNILTIIALSYILVIGSVWLFILFPIFSQREDWIWFNNLTGFYNHVVTPIIFSIFTILCIKTNKFQTKIYYLSAFKWFIFYVLIYSIYVFFLPGIVNVSVYGLITNIWSSSGGNPLFIFLLFILIGYQILVYSLVWWISNIIIKKSKRKKLS